MKSALRGWTYLVLAFLTVPIITGSVSAQSSSVKNLAFDGLDGSSSRLSTYLGKGPVYLSFWALWCEPCKLELRALKSFAKEHENDPRQGVATGTH